MSGSGKFDAPSRYLVMKQYLKNWTLGRTSETSMLWFNFFKRFNHDWTRWQI